MRLYLRLPRLVRLLDPVAGGVRRVHLVDDDNLAVRILVLWVFVLTAV